MAYFAPATKILGNSEVRKYFLSVLQSNLTSEDKYERFIVFFAKQEELESSLLSRYPGLNNQNIETAIADAGEKIGIWKPAEILQQTENTLQRALNRIQGSQHPDGGWGYSWQRSSIWGTTYAVMALQTANQTLEVPFPTNRIIGQGIAWIKEHAPDWSVTGLGANEEKPLYEAAIAVRCMYYLRQADFEPVRDCLHVLLESQNADGGWDARVWGTELGLRRKVFSEVGATSAVLQALAASNKREYSVLLKNAIAWILRFQNDDGSWNDGSCEPGKPGLGGKPSIHKTCDALKAIIAARDLGMDDVDRPYIDKALKWLLQQEKLVPKGDQGGIGWGYDEKGPNSPFRPELEGTCLTLETLVQIDGVSLPLITTSARWLMDAQHKQPGGVEDGKWESGDTFRTTLALLRYYTKIKADPSFRITDESGVSQSLEARKVTKRTKRTEP